MAEPIRFNKPPRRALVFQAVRLQAEGYSVPVGTVGVVDEEVAEGHYAVSWAGHGGSVPVAGGDLEALGELSIHHPALDAERKVERARERLEYVVSYGIYPVAVREALAALTEDASEEDVPTQYLPNEDAS